MRVIKPEPHHVHDVTLLIESFLAEGIEDWGFGYNESDSQASFFTWLDTQCLLLLEADDKIVGIFAGLYSAHPFNYETIVLGEMMFYVLPDYRRGSVLLLKEVEEIARSQGVTKLVLGHTANTKADKLARFFKMKGYKELERHYVKDLI